MKIGGLLVRPHKPPTANGLVFFSLSDETALAQVAVLPPVSRQHSAALTALYHTGLCGGGPVLVTGRAETRGEGISLLATQLHSLSCQGRIDPRRSCKATPGGAGDVRP